jgi:hypothetical protein
MEAREAPGALWLVVEQQINLIGHEIDKLG